ncbi:MAG: hypothetical protein QM718_11020 [Steroidobacteraceae bacterium]
MTATASIASRAGAVDGFYVASTAAGTLVLRDGDASGVQLSGTITPAVGWHSFPAKYSNGLHATIGGTLDVTFFTK